MKFLSLALLVVLACGSALAGGKTHCKSCITIADVGKQILSAGISAEHVEDLANMFCGAFFSWVPDMAKDFCPKSIILAHNKAYEEIVINDRKPKEICSLVRLC